MTSARLLLRRHRAALASWFLLLTGLSAATVTAYQRTYATGQQRAVAVALAQNNAASNLIYGRLPDPGTPAQMYAWEIGAFVTVLAAVMGVILAVSLTRAAEDDGTLELMRGCGLTPRQPLRAALGVLTACAAVLAAGCAAGAGIHAGRVDGITVAGSIAYGLVVGLTFLLVATLTVLLAQIASTSRQARLLGLTAVGISFAVRAIADAHRTGWLNWVSPLGLRATTGPFTTDRWVALAAPATAVALFGAAAVVLSDRREFGSGMLPRRDTRPDRLNIRSVAALTVRLTRNSLLVWTVAVAAIGAFFSAMGSGVVDERRAGEIGGFLGAQLGKNDPVAGYLSYCGTVVGIVVCVYGILLVSESRQSERAGLTDLVLTTGVRRWVPLATQSVVAAGGCAVVLTATGLLDALVARSVLDGDDVAARAFFYVLGQWPSAAVIIGCTTLLAGAAPRLTALAWLPLAAGAVIALLGDLLGVPQSIQDLGIFQHVPDIAAPGPPLAGLLLLTGVGVALCVAGSGAVARRDLAG
jgi:ABC-2 type transport system permease protein